MGNRAKRVALAKALKAAGYGRLYTCSAKVAREYYRASTMKALIFRAGLKAGDLVSDCDLFNHVFHSQEVRVVHPGEYWRWYSACGIVKSFSDQCYLDGGNLLSCGCSASPWFAESREQILTSLRAWLSPAESSEWSKTRFYNALRDALAKDKEIINGDGCLLPEFVALKYS